MRSAGLLSTSLIALTALLLGCTEINSEETPLDKQLEGLLKQAGFTGTIDANLEKKLGRKLDPKLVELGRMLFFDKLPALHDDNSCAGCHAPAAGFGDWESIAIGVDNNDVVGPGRTGPHNQRRTPMVLNNAFYPKLMWNGRFFSAAGDPFDNSKGFTFPPPEGEKEFPANAPNVKTLLAAQGHIPGTELPEMAGFTGISGTSFSSERFQAKRSQKELLKALGQSDSNVSVQVFPADGGIKTASLTGNDDPDFAQFDDGHGEKLPPLAGDGTRNYPIREVILARLNGSSAYRRLFGDIFPEVAAGNPITYPMIGAALAEFQLSLSFADAPIDRYMRDDDHSALTEGEKRGAVLFFTKANCSSCHSVSGPSNEMFSDFQNYNVGTPQIHPAFGKGLGNVPFRNANGDFKINGSYDFGLEDITGNAQDRFKFRTTPLRNLHLQKTFFHNGAFTRLEDAVAYHLDPATNWKAYSPARAGVVKELHSLADMAVVMGSLDPKIQPVQLSKAELADLVAFLINGLADPDASPENLSKLIPETLPSGRKLQTFQR